MANEALERDNLRKMVDAMAEIGGWPDEYLPCDYLVLDIETLGFSFKTCEIVQIGMCEVRDCEISEDILGRPYGGYTIKWPAEKFLKKEQAVAVHGITAEKSAASDWEPEEAFNTVYSFIKYALSNNMKIVGHNFFGFDGPFLTHSFAKVGLTHTFKHDEMVDTNLICKAMQLGMMPDVRTDKSLFDFYARVKSYRAKGVFSSLDKYCVDRFCLKEKYGVNQDDAHDAGYDCWLTHLVIRELNIMLGYTYE